MQSSDTIVIQGLSLTTLIGVHSWEKKLPQKILLNLELKYDTQQAAQTDNLSNTIDYQAVVNAIVAFANTNQFNLVETLAEKLCGLLFEQFSFVSIKCELLKLNALPNTQAVGVRIERHRSTL